MHKKLLSTLLSLTLCVTVSFSQNFNGSQAEQLVAGSEWVRMGQNSAFPEFVKLRQNAQFPASKFPDWAKRTFKLDQNIDFVKLRDEADKEGMQHNRYQVTNNGVPVFGAFAYTHAQNNMVLSFNGKLPTQIEVKQPTLSEANAMQRAKQHIGATTYKWELAGEEAHLKWETNDTTATYFPTAELVYINPSFNFKDGTHFRLAYAFDIYAHQPLYRALVFVDALTGQVLFENHKIHAADVVGTAETGYSGTQSIVTDSFQDGYRLREAGRGNGIRTFDMNQGTTYGNAVDFVDSDNYWNNVNGNYDQYATDAHWGAQMTYDYFLNEHGRNGIDNNNMVINSYVHYDVDYFNAFWDGSRMTYGDGTGTPLTALDICAHEMAHGVTEFTAGLIYQDEYGALNESFSDIFGAAVEFKMNPTSGDWLMGEDVGTFRSMSNPPDYGDPDTYFGNNWVTGTTDNGGVHSNSGVQNKWFYILVEGESGTNDLGNSYNVSGIGLDDAQAIAYRNLSVYLGPTSEYADARFYSIQAAIDLFGGCSPQVIATTNAWYAVGVGDAFDPTVTSNFTASMTSHCDAPAAISFTNLSTNGSSFVWDFGDGNTSTALNPTHTYTAQGVYNVTLTVDGDNCGTATEAKPNYISLTPANPCIAIMPSTGNQTLSWCTGTLYDDGGPNGNYGNYNDVVTTIAPPGATSVTLNFTAFGFEEDYDYLWIYDGPNTASPVIGQYTGFSLPNGGSITSTGGAITLKRSSDPYVNELGFALNWQCLQPNAPPTALFSASTLVSCNGEISFTDQSINGATSWLWDFGDGNTSTSQNPTHTYQNQGTYTVSLTATNSFGSHLASQNNYITVNWPAGPTAFGNARCDAGQLSLSASSTATLRWFDQPLGGTAIGSGATFNTPPISSSTTFYVQNEVLPATYNVGPANNSFGGGSNFEGDQHLQFSAYDNFVLKTVKVYAQGSGNRTIQLRDNTGTVLQSATINIPAGEQIVTLNFSIQPGNNYQLGTAGVPNLYRNNSGPSYPYTLSNLVSITNSSAGPDYYYHFYDWEIETPGCISERTAVVAEIATAPTAQNNARCGTGSVVLTATGSNLSWYDAATGGNQLGTGSSFTTPSISNTTSYFAESNVLPVLQYGGPQTNNFGTGSNFNNIQSLLFDCYQPATLVSVKVYAQGAGNRTIELRNSAGTVIESATVNIPSGESRVTLNFSLPVGTDLQLGTAAPPNLYRNNSDPSYPYQIPGTLAITSSTAGPDYYYFFYDWEVQREGCTTPRTEVVASVNKQVDVTVSPNQEICQGQSVMLNGTATNANGVSWSTGATTDTITVAPSSTTAYVFSGTNNCGTSTDTVHVTIHPTPAQPTITATGQLLTSSAAASYQWYKDGTIISGATQQSYAPTQAGNYTVEITDSFGCSSVSNPFNWITVGVAQIAHELRIAPNPFSNQLLVSSSTDINSVRLLDVSGRVVFESNIAARTLALQTSAWANGIYILKATTAHGRFTQKVVKANH